MLQYYELKCPECGYEFVATLDKVGLEGFSIECPSCHEEVDDACITGEKGGTKPSADPLKVNY